MMTVSSNIGGDIGFQLWSSCAGSPPARLIRPGAIDVLPAPRKTNSSNILGYTWVY